MYQSLRSGLATRGVEVFWLGLGARAQVAAAAPRWVRERSEGIVLAGDTQDDKQQAAVLVNFLESGACDGVFINVLSDRVLTNAMRYASSKVRRVMIVHTTSRASYKAARSLRDHVHWTVGVSPRIKSDLVRTCGFPLEFTRAIPSAVRIEDFQAARRAPKDREALRLLSLGRISDFDKGVFWLPRILEHLPVGEATLTIAGDGNDTSELRRRCAHLGDRVRFVGPIAREQVPEYLARHDVFLFPSRFEGLGIGLVEAMASGCVPVASRIKGVTDFVVRDGEDGLLFDIGDVRAAARAIADLATDRDRLAELSSAARNNVLGRFDLASMTQAYFDVLSAVTKDSCEIRSPLAIDAWAYPSGLRPGLSAHLPLGLKNWLRFWRERFK